MPRLAPKALGGPHSQHFANRPLPPRPPFSWPPSWLAPLLAPLGLSSLRFPHLPLIHLAAGRCGPWHPAGKVMRRAAPAAGPGRLGPGRRSSGAASSLRGASQAGERCKQATFTKPIWNSGCPGLSPEAADAAGWASSPAERRMPSWPELSSVCCSLLRVMQKMGRMTALMHVFVLAAFAHGLRIVSLHFASSALRVATVTPQYARCTLASPARKSQWFSTSAVLSAKYAFGGLATHAWRGCGRA